MAKISHNYYYIIFTFVIVAMDQIIKAQMTFKELFIKNEDLFLFNDLSLSYSNKLFLVIITNIIFIFIFWIILNNFNIKSKKLIFLLVSSGLISNLIDRMFKSYVVDYIIVSNIVFNIADIAIWIGVLLFIFSISKNLFMVKKIL